MTLDEFLRQQAKNNDLIVVRRRYIEASGGDIHAGVMLSQLVYWMGFRRSGEPRATIMFDGKRWIAKRAAEWLDECFLTVDQARRCVEILKEKGLIETVVRKFQGTPVTHITLTDKIIEVSVLGFSPNRGVLGPQPELDCGYSPSPSINVSETTPENTDLIGKRNPRRTGNCTLKTYFKSCKEAGVDPIPENDSVFEYVDKIGLSREMIELAWLVFQRKYTENEKKYKCWPTVFRNAVRENWFKLWWQSPEGWALTTAGKQAQLEHESKGSDE